MPVRQGDTPIERLTVNVWPDFARMIGVGRNKAYDLVNSGDVRVVRVGSRIIIPRTAIDEFLSGTPQSESSS